MTQFIPYGEDNAVLLHFEQEVFVWRGNRLWHFGGVEWSTSGRDFQKTNESGSWPDLMMSAPIYVKINERLTIRFHQGGYEKIHSIDRSSMVNEIVKKLHDDGVLLEWISGRFLLRALLPDRVVELGCDVLRTCIVSADMIMPIHIGKENILYRVVKDAWDPMATSFIKEYPKEIERIYHELF